MWKNHNLKLICEHAESLSPIVDNMWKFCGELFRGSNKSQSSCGQYVDNTPTYPHSFHSGKSVKKCKKGIVSGILLKYNCEYIN